MLLFVAFAHAQDLPWECVAVATPADARPYVDAVRAETSGIDEAGEAALALAEAWVDTSCLTDCSGGAGTCWTAACTTSAGAWVEYDETEVDTSSGSTVGSSSELHVVVEPPGEAWTRLEITKHWSSRRDTAGTIMPHSEATDWDVSWAGTLDADWPVDGGFTASTSQSTYTSTTYDAAWDDGTCAWSVDDIASATVGGTEVEVTYTYDTCTGGYFMVSGAATIDGAPYGVVDGDTWADASDDDGDGYIGDSWYDCDDTDATVHWCATEVLYDGLDQDCDGTDPTDYDSDGYDAIEVGGTDCDDTNRRVYPGAADTWYDGVDSDCAGDDDYDQDLDRSPTPDDCDDTDPSIRPRAVDLLRDGIDQNCDGRDGPSVGLGVPGAGCTSVPGSGAPAGLGLLALLLLRRRARK